MDEMKYVKIKDIGQVISGSTPSRNISEYWNGTIPWVAPKEINKLQTPYLNKSAEMITELGLKSCSAKLLPRGSILFSSRAPIGLVAVTNIEVSTNQGFKSIVPNNDIVPLYVYYFLKSQTKQLNNLGTGTTFKELSKSVFENYKIPLPDTFSEQQKIASILSKAEALIKQRKESIALLDEFLKSTFLEMFGDPVRNEKGWEKKTLDDVSTQITDGEHKTPLRIESGIKLLSARNIRNSFIDFNTGVDYISESEYYRISKRCKPEKMDILMSCSGSVGRVTVINTIEKISLVRSVALIKLDKKK